MVIGAFPIAKLGALALRQVSKPIANKIIEKAKSSPIFRKYVCLPPAQFYNWMEVKTKMWALNLGRPVEVPPLNETAAIELGANLLGEFIIFAIASGVLMFELTRQSYNDRKKQDAIRMEKEELGNKLMEISLWLERQDAQLREITRVLVNMGKSIKTEPYERSENVQLVSSTQKASTSTEANQTEVSTKQNAAQTVEAKT